VIASDLSKSIRRTRPLCSPAVSVGSLKTLPKREKITSHFWEISTRILRDSPARPRNDPVNQPRQRPQPRPRRRQKHKQQRHKTSPIQTPAAFPTKAGEAAFLIARIFKGTALGLFSSNKAINFLYELRQFRNSQISFIVKIRDVAISDSLIKLARNDTP
jgi:hypothetical protein